MKKRADAMLFQVNPFNKLYLTCFINDLTEIGMQVTMVLDDIGMIRNNKIISHLEFLIRHLPSNIHLVLSGREYLEIGLAKYKARDEVLILTGKEISFTGEETVSFFRDIAHINLSQEEYAKVSHVFEGWITGMQLMALTVKEAERFKIPQMTGRTLIYTYLMEEVMHRLDDDIKNFLIETSILERFCPELCEFLFSMEIFQADNIRKTISELESLNLFLICLDKKEGWFRYHKLFRDFL